MLTVTLYTKPGCHLCGDLLTSLHAMQSELNFQIAERDIEQSPDDFSRFQYVIPVLDIPGSGLMFPPHDLYAIRHEIAAVDNSAAENS